MLKPLSAMAATLLALDLLWLGIVAPTFYRGQIGHLMADKPTWWAAFLFYLVYTFGVWFFVVQPGLAAHAPLRETLIRGALFGLVCYSAFDLTSQAVLKDWPVTLTVVDLTWGAILTTLVTWAGWWAGQAR
jgi:uncharacterized membrane protein